AFCQYLTEFKLPSSVRHIGELAFSCARVFELELPEGMTEIGPGAFWGSMLRLVIIPASMKKIGAQAFWDSSLGEAYFVGLPPKLEESEWGGLPFDRIRGELTIYYPRVLASAWAPNGETTWNGYNIKPYDTLPEITGNWDEPGILRWGDEW
ncbi:MAG: leucine-rich repeat domain-containing protein, partial [Clostridiales bacterium]|nr:leucine-rich repeat domain-containing protein [Clostridiales bacterium]